MLLLQWQTLLPSGNKVNDVYSTMCAWRAHDFIWLRQMDQDMSLDEAREGRWLYAWLAFTGCALWEVLDEVHMQPYVSGYSCALLRRWVANEPVIMLRGAEYLIRRQIDQELLLSIPPPSQDLTCPQICKKADGWSKVTSAAGSVV